MKIALLSHPTARQPVAILDVATVGELRREMALLPAAGYCMAVEVNDPTNRAATWRCVPPQNPDGTLRLASYLTVRSGFGPPGDCAAIWNAARAAADYYRESNRQLWALTA